MTIYTLSTQYYDKRFDEVHWEKTQFVGLQGLKLALESAHDFIKKYKKHCYITHVRVYKTTIMGNGWARY